MTKVNKTHKTPQKKKTKTKRTVPPAPKKKPITVDDWCGVDSMVRNNMLSLAHTYFKASIPCHKESQDLKVKKARNFNKWAKKKKEQIQKALDDNGGKVLKSSARRKLLFD